MPTKNGRGKGFTDLEVDAAKEREGEWFPLDGPCEGIDVKLRSPFCDDYRRMSGRLQQSRKVFSADGNADIVALEMTTNECIGTCLLVGWRGDERWAALEPWSKELAVSLMSEHRNRKISNAVSKLVRRLGNEEEVARAEEGKDSGPLSDAIST